MQKSEQPWVKPELVRLGRLADVAAQNTGPNQCGSTGGGCTPKS